MAPTVSTGGDGLPTMVCDRLLPLPMPCDIVKRAMFLHVLYVFVPQVGPLLCQQGPDSPHALVQGAAPWHTTTRCRFTTLCTQGAFTPTEFVQGVAHTIMDKLGGKGSYCALHVRRGDKLTQVEGLDEATQPAAIYKKIKGKCPPGKVLYLATNEKDPTFFDDLEQHWKVFTYRLVPGSRCTHRIRKL